MPAQVRRGDLVAFKSVAERYAAVFAADKTANLIVRLRRNVIRTGLRHISLAYSRISLSDVAAKLARTPSNLRASNRHLIVSYLI